MGILGWGHKPQCLDFLSDVSPAVCLLATFSIVIGVLSVFVALRRVAVGVYVFFLRPGKSLKKLGQWAVVTGATDGIGKAYAYALARKGLNVVLVARTKSKLEDAAKEITSKYNVQTQEIVTDFSKADKENFAALQAGLDGLDVGVLINNVGLSYDHAEYFLALSDQEIDDIVNVNIQSVHKVTRIVLPGMKQRRRGAIVNIGSAASTVAPSGALYAVYAGTKAYVDMFSKSLDLEYRPFGITIQNQAPAYVATKMSKIRKPRLDAPTPTRWVSSAINHIGYESSYCPYWFHGLLWAFAYSLPEWIVNSNITNMHMGLHKKYLKKVARQKGT